MASVRQILPEGMALIKEFEGLELSAYPDPGTGGEPYTIGYGHTGGVSLGDRISLEEAELYLADDLWLFEGCVEDICPGLNHWEFSALVSFAYNVGCSALGGSTLARRLKAGEDPQIVLPEELPRWNKGGNGPLPGLTRRRAAEIKLAQTPPGRPTLVEPKGEARSTPQAPSGAAQVCLEDFFKYYSEQPHQIRGISVLEAELLEIAPELLESDAYWVKEYRQQNEPVLGQELRPKKSGIIKLPVTYQCQVDSEFMGGKDALRMCFSSSCAMLLDYIDPDALRGHGQVDDYYLEKLNQLGYDSTDAAGQIATLKHFGLDATFRTNGTLQSLKRLLAEDIPIPCGILHYGPPNSPHGGGHWMTIVGIDENAGQLIAHDPYGLLDNDGAGGYLATDCQSGRFVRYNISNWLARWEIVGGDGWFVEARP